MLKKSILGAALVLSATLGSGLMTSDASAQSYVGASVGRAKWNFDCYSTISCHRASGSWKIFGGYEFTPHMSLEGSYVYFNQVGVNTKIAKFGVNGRGGDIAAVFKTSPVNNFHGFAKAGVAFMKGEIIGVEYNTPTVDPKTTTLIPFASSTHYSLQPLFGLGVGYQLNKDVSLRAEVDFRRVKLTNYYDSTHDVNNFSFGIQSNF